MRNGDLSTLQRIVTIILGSRLFSSLGLVALYHLVKKGRRPITALAMLVNHYGRMFGDEEWYTHGRTRAYHLHANILKVLIADWIANEMKILPLLTELGRALGPLHPNSPSREEFDSVATALSAVRGFGGPYFSERALRLVYAAHGKQIPGDAFLSMNCKEATKLLGVSSFTEYQQAPSTHTQLQHTVTDVGALAYEVCEFERAWTRPELSEAQLRWCRELADCLEVHSSVSPITRAFVGTVRGAGLCERPLGGTRAPHADP